MEAITARQEWRSMWTLPLTAMIGVSGSGMFAYSSGIFMQAITGEFGWNRAQYSAVFVITMLQGLVTGPLVGRLVDRYGPRMVVLAGMVPFAVSFSALGLVGGQFWQWTALCLVMSLFQVAISQTAWVAGVIPRFHASRGMALAVTLAGLGLSSFVWPPIAAVFIDRFGWRAAFPAIALVYTVVALPLTAIFFHSPQRLEAAAHAAPAGRRGYAKEIMSRSFIGLVLAGALFASAYYGLLVHFVPILTNSGIGFAAAAGIVALVGLAAIAGRLLSGLLLDALPTRPVTLAAFLLPLASVALLIGLPGSVPGSVVAVLALGLASGAELNIITYILARRFGQKVFGAIYAIFMAIISIGASIGPVLAGALFDARGSYDSYLLLLGPIFLVASALIAWVPIAPHKEPPDAR